MHARIYAAEIDLSVLTTHQVASINIHYAPPPSNTVPKVHARFPRKQHLDRLISRDEHTQRASETTPLRLQVWYSASQMHLCGLIIERPDNHYKITERPVNLIVIIPLQVIISCTCKMPPHWHSIKYNFCSGPNSRGAEISRVFCVKAAAVPLKTISTSGRQMSNIACVLSCK